MKTNDINKFIDFSIEAFESDNSEIYAELGVSKEDYLNDKLRLIKRLKLKSTAAANKAKNENLLNLAKQKIIGIINANNEYLKRGLEQLLREKDPQFQFRNIEKLDNDDLMEIINDIGVIDIIEGLEKLDNDKQ